VSALASTSQNGQLANPIKHHPLHYSSLQRRESLYVEFLAKMSRRASLQPTSLLSANQSPQPAPGLLLQPPRLTTLSTSRTQRLGSQPTLLYSTGTQLLKPGGGTPVSMLEKMPVQLEDGSNQEHIPRQQRRSQPSIFSAEMHPHLIAAKSGHLGHSQPMLCFNNKVNGSSEFLYPLRTPPLIQRAHNHSGSSSKTSSPSTGRKLPRIPPPERRILRRSPQSDLFPRFQQHRHQLESGSASQIAFPNELIQTKLETGKSFRCNFKIWGKNFAYLKIYWPISMCHRGVYNLP
jgi:hypothetical protein